MSLCDLWTTQIVLFIVCIGNEHLCKRDIEIGLELEMLVQFGKFGSFWGKYWVFDEFRDLKRIKDKL